MQDRYVTYREIEASLGIFSISINITWTPGGKKDWLSLAPADIDNRSKKVRVDWCKEMLQKYYCGAQKTFMGSLQLTDHGSVRMSPKQSNSPPYGPLNPSQIHGKLFVKKSLRSKWWPVSSAKLVMWALFHLSIVGRSILSGTPQFVCLKSSQKFKKRTGEDESLFSMTMRALTHRLKSAPYWLTKTAAVQPWLGTQWLLFIAAHEEKNACSTIFVARRCSWSVQKPSFAAVSIGVEKQTQTWS